MKFVMMIVSILYVAKTALMFRCLLYKKVGGEMQSPRLMLCQHLPSYLTPHAVTGFHSLTPPVAAALDAMA